MSAGVPSVGPDSINVVKLSNLICQSEFPPPMPWIGMDIGGTLAKLVYFEPADMTGVTGRTRSQEDERILSNVRHYLTKNEAYGDSGHRDFHLQMNDVTIGGVRGSLHFIRFPTSQMNAFLQLAKSKGMASLATTFCATGGGAHKFQEAIQRIVQVKLRKYDEIDSLVRGVSFMENHNEGELFYFEAPQEDITCMEKAKCAAKASYPFLLVNIGSGVSILSVRGPNQYQRISGTSLGGGTFLGLCCLLTGCDTFEEALELAAQGDNQKVDKLVRDIYGGDYTRFGLNGDVVASSFGQMNCKQWRCKATVQDLARATLVTITNNIGSLARLCAKAEAIEQVIFVGNFLRINPISMKMLAYAMDYWSSGLMKALFCEHEGYFGAIGCLLELVTPVS